MLKIISILLLVLSTPALAGDHSNDPTRRNTNEDSIDPNALVDPNAKVDEFGHRFYIYQGKEIPVPGHMHFWKWGEMCRHRPQLAECEKLAKPK